MKLKDKVAIITGASQGFGFEIAKEFIAEGAKVAICARNKESLLKAKEDLGANVLAIQADISQKEQVDGLVQAAASKFGTIDILIANAGIYGVKGPIEDVNWDEWSSCIDINLKGTVLQCRAVIPAFKQQGFGKIIIISGGGATKPMPYLSAYAASKAAVVRFAETLALELRDFNIEVNTVAPGALNTRLLTEIIEAGPHKVGPDFYNQALKQQQTGGTPLNIGAKLCTYLASANGITGKLISAVWDPWQDFSAKLKLIDQSDIYTLRRIVPEDRGFNWEV